MVLEVASVFVSAAAYADTSSSGLVGYVGDRIARDLPVFAIGALVGAVVGAAVADGWGVRRRWIVAVAAALGVGYVAIWVAGVIGGLAG